jgi:hypothetical protein
MMVFYCVIVLVDQTKLHAVVKLELQATICSEGEDANIDRDYIEKPDKNGPKKGPWWEEQSITTIFILWIKEKWKASQLFLCSKPNKKKLWCISLSIQKTFHEAKESNSTLTA